MQCLENIIGALDCAGSQDPAPVLLINQLPGISISNIEALAGDQQDTFWDVWKNITFRAMQKFEILVKAEINKCYKITDKAVVSCLICANKELFYVALWYLHGTEVMIERTGTDALNRYTTIDLEKADQLKADFFTEFTAALSDAVNSMDMSAGGCIDDECLECNDKVKFVTKLP